MPLIKYGQGKLGFQHDYSVNACGTACICSVIHSLTFVSPCPAVVFHKIRTSALSPRFGAALHKMAKYMKKYGLNVSYSPPISYDPVTLFMWRKLKVSSIQKCNSHETPHQDEVYKIRLIKSFESHTYYHYIVEDNSGFYMDPARNGEIRYRRVAINQHYGAEFVDTGLSLIVSLA